MSIYRGNTQLSKIYKGALEITKVFKNGVNLIIQAFSPKENFEIVTYTGNGGTQSITGNIGKAASFNGSSSEIQFTTDSNFVNDFTISAWINMNQLPVSAYLYQVVAWGDEATGERRSLGIWNGGSGDPKVYFSGYGASANFGGSTSISANQWYHVCVTRSGSTVKVYLNGSIDGTGTVTLNAYTGTTGRIGNSGTANEVFNGSIDQVRIFKKALSSTEVTTLYGETYASSTKSTTDIFGDSSGVALYQLDEDANDTGGLDYVFTTWDSTLSSVPNYSEGNLRMTGGSGNKIGYSVDSVSSGKWYWEHEIISIGGESSFGIARPGDLGSHYVVGTSSTSWGLYVNGNLYHNGSVSTSGYMSGGFSNGDIIGVELDLDNGTIEFFKNGTGYGNAFTGLSGEFLVAAEARTTSGTNDHRTNFGASTWDYTPSTGFAGINTEYNGTPTNVNFLGMAFQPDLVWIKQRSAPATSNFLFDVIRGTPNWVSSDSTISQNPASGVTSFEANGFNLGANGSMNGSSKNYVAWCWKAGGAAVSGTSSQATSVTISPNTDAGFSIVKFTSSTSAAQPPPMNYISHGLEAAPEMVIYKCLNTSQNWVVQHDGITTNGSLNLDLSNSQSGPFTYDFFDNTSTNIGVRSNYAISRDRPYIAYCFHSVDGYQKVGSYTGNGSNTGPTITTGFRPRFVLIKGTNTTVAKHWNLFDTVRDTDANVGKVLHPNLSNQEGDYGANSLNMSDTGFSVNDSDSDHNEDGKTYIYLAIA